MTSPSDEREQEYRDATQHLHEFGPRLEQLLKDLISELDVRLLYVRARVKSSDSAQKKLTDKSERYDRIDQLTDLMGIRVVTYLNEDVKTVADHLALRLDTDEANSGDKRDLLEADRFGYLSVHFVATLPEAIHAFPGYQKYAGSKFEIQVRSALQHTWAEIEHDLGYKASNTTPKPVKRRFARLSALLELADNEFDSLRQELSQYEKTVKSNVGEVKTGLEIDQATLVAALSERSEYRKLDENVAEAFGRQLKSEIDSSYISSRVADLQELGLSDLDALTEFLRSSAAHVPKFAEVYFRHPRRRGTLNSGPAIPRGVGLLYLSIVYREHYDLPQFARWAETDPEGRRRTQMQDDAWQEVVGELGDIEPTQ